MVESGITLEEIKTELEKPIKKTFPLLLCVFITTKGRHHHMDVFFGGNVPSTKLQIYTWKAATTLKELV